MINAKKLDHGLTSIPGDTSTVETGSQQTNSNLIRDHPKLFNQPGDLFH